MIDEKQYPVGILVLRQTPRLCALQRILYQDKFFLHQTKSCRVTRQLRAICYTRDVESATR